MNADGCPKVVSPSMSNGGAGSWSDDVKVGVGVSVHGVNFRIHVHQVVVPSRVGTVSAGSRRMIMCVSSASSWNAEQAKHLLQHGVGSAPNLTLVCEGPPEWAAHTT